MQSARHRPRILLWVGLTLGAFVLADLGLFGWLIFRSLSQREINRVILEAREEAQELADQIAGEAESRGQDLYTALAVERETQRYIDSVLTQRDIVETVEIFDADGVLVFRGQRDETQYAGEGALEEDLDPSGLLVRQLDRETSFENVEVPVGNVGTFVIGISRGELERRLQVLRGDLLQQAALIGALTIVLFAAGYLLIWWLQRGRARLEQKAEESERMAFVGTLASGLAHEIRSPLNSLNLNMQMLQEEMATGDARSTPRLVALTRSEIGRLEHLVTDFLSFARPRALELEEVEGGTILERLKELHSARLEEERIACVVEDSSAGALVLVDLDQILQALTNLLDNSIKALAGASARKITLECRRRGQKVHLAVVDNGPGMAEEDAQKVFDVFYSKRRGGTGLGLAIVRRIAQSHDGEVFFDSSPGKGTRVEVRLPLVAHSPAERQSPVPRASVSVS